MSKKVKAADTINYTTLHELLQMMDAKLNHIEDITADNRAVIIKLVKQSNQIVRFLSNIEIEDVTDEFDPLGPPPFSEAESFHKDSKMRKLKDLIDDFMERQEDLKEFEEELKKNKDKLTPGQIGES